MVFMGKGWPRHAVQRQR
ncbi:Ankyrin repeat family protein [Zea mays]|uniref:Ankyrin repeat family protein n=1 Tax=Zea mays TaxID=4577 RepID=A0A1D6HP06_MAIZE|nr:Ankyrin repeat family protein [Zea mays]